MAGYATYTDKKVGTECIELRVNATGGSRDPFGPLMQRERIYVPVSIKELIQDTSLESCTNVHVQLDGDELDYAQEILGAARVSKRVVRYYGDEAKRIIANWG